MKKIVGLCLVVLLSTASVFAQDGQRRGQRQRGEMDPSERIEKMVKDLNLNEDQAVRFRAVENEYAEKMRTDRENLNRRGNTDNKTADERRAEMDKRRTEMEKVQDERNTRIKEILNEDQYRNYLEQQQPMRDRTPRDKQRGDRND